MLGDYELFKKEILDLTEIDLNLYKEKQMKRRLDTLIEKLKIPSYADYVSLLKSDARKLDAFLDYITINVTEFFRTPDHWNLLETEVIPRLASLFPDGVTVWSTACSSGEEPYSLAMSFLQAYPAEEIRIIASDIDEKMLAKAAEGVFTSDAVGKVPEALRSRYFVPEGNRWRVCDEVRKCVEFRKLDLLRDPYPQGCHLVVCRNVLIYFTEEGKEKLYSAFYDCLKMGGTLFLGNTEQIVYYKKLGFKKERPCFYTKLPRSEASSVRFGFV